MNNLFPTYQRWDIKPAMAEGSWMIDTSGNKYLDFTSGIGVVNLGHSNVAIKESVKAQLDKFWHTSNLFSIPIQEETASLLTGISGLNRVFFCNSGAEANEAAIKLARKATGKSKIVTCLQSFHGRTFATMAATGQEKVRTGYGPMLETFHHSVYNSISDIEQAVDDQTAAVLLEIVQGEGGVHKATDEYISKVKEVCEKTGALLIIDEVQTGIGRTGKAFAFQHFHINPDIVTVAKGLGNGLPIGAMLGKEELAEYFGPGSHGSTFGGNPICVAAAKATLNVLIHTSLLSEVESKGQYLLSQLENSLNKLETVQEVRGLGLMIGIQLKENAEPYLKQLQKMGLLTLTAGPNVIRLLPPLTVNEEEMNMAISYITEICSKSPLTV